MPFGAWGFKSPIRSIQLASTATTLTARIRSHGMRKHGTQPQSAFILAVSS